MKWNNEIMTNSWAEKALLFVLSPIILLIYITTGLAWIQDKIRLFLIDKFGVSTEPHIWFAWYPVAYSTWSESYGQTIWLEKIWRARSSKKIGGFVAYGSSKEDLENILD